MSEPLYAPRLRPERLIAAGRVILAASSLFAVWLDVDEPVRFAPAAYGVLVGYAVYAVAAGGLLWRLETVPARWPVVTHATDLICFSLFIFFTEGPASPFTVYFVFALLSATLRWQARGTLWTAVIVIGAFLGFGVYFGLILDDPGFDLRAVIIRGVYLVVLAGLLGYVGTQHQRTLREMWGLAAWPQAMHDDAESLSQELLAYAARLMNAPRAVLTWTEDDTPWRWVATWNRGRWSYERQAAHREVVDDALRTRAFIQHAGSGRRTLVQETAGPALVSWPGDPIDPALADRLGAGTVVSVPVHGESFTGRLFVLERPDATFDDLVLTEIVAGMVATRLDAFHLTQQLRQAAATEERIRLARDLHDGVLQSFTGIALRLAAIRRLMANEPAAAAPELERVQRVLASEQRDLRFYIQELGPGPSRAAGEDLEPRLLELAQRMEREWDLRVELDLPERLHLQAGLGRDVYHLVREALVNAARHGAASVARVALGSGEANVLTVSIADNGRGFPFTGRYSADELTTLDLGPKTLRERVRAMDGSLTLESGDAGATLTVILPRGVAA